MNNEVVISIAMPKDAHILAEIGSLTFYETWRSVNTEEDMQLYMKEAFNTEKIKTDLSDTGINLFLIATENQNAIGYAKMRRDRTHNEFKGEKAIEVERIYVKVEYQKKKIGKLLMDRCIEIATAEKKNWLWLGVNDENEKAIDFYKKYGFEIFGTKMFKLGQAEDRDFLMKLRIK